MRRLVLFLGLGLALAGTAACEEQPATPLTQAAAHNDVAAIRSLLTAGQNVDDAGHDMTALVWASRTGSLDAVRLLLESGADVNLPDPAHHWTPLQHAILTRQADVVGLLLDRGADPNRHAVPETATDEGIGQWPPLLLAAGDSDPAFVTLLLAHGANPTVEGESGETALSIAVSSGGAHGPDRPMGGGCRVATVRALLSHDGPQRLKHDFIGNQAIAWARLQGCDAILALIGEKPTKRVQRIFAAADVLRGQLRPVAQSVGRAVTGAKRPDDRPQTPATDAPSPR
jgi:ankyrin repeat protein